MLDLAGIMFSSVMMLLVIIRAVQIDQTQPWFQTVKRKEKIQDKKSQPWRPQS